MKLNKLVLIFFSLILVIQAFSQVTDGFTEVQDISAVKEMISTNADETNSLSSDFIQEKHLTMMEEVLISRGLFLFRQENDVRWEYHSPINYAIVINNNQFMINNDGKISTFDTESNKLFKEINNMILMAIQGNFVDDPGFQASFFADNSHYLTILKPQDEILKNILETIEIYFDKESMAVAKVMFIEPEEDFTLITFTNRKKNTKLEDDQFKISE